MLIRASARHLLDVAVKERGYRAAAPGLLHDFDSALTGCIIGDPALVLDGIAAEAEPVDTMLTAWRAFVARWTTTRIAADWPGFAIAVQAMVPRMLARIDHEEACLIRMTARPAGDSEGATLG